MKSKRPNYTNKVSLDRKLFQVSYYYKFVIFEAARAKQSALKVNASCNFGCDSAENATVSTR